MSEDDPFKDGQRYDDVWLMLADSSYEYQADRWLRRIAGQTIVDLGSGQNTRRFEAFLKKYGAIEYLPIDINNDQAEDMLAAALELEPDEGYSFSLNGINEAIVSAYSDYGKQLASQIIRLLHPEGLVFGFGGGGVLKALSERDGMESQFIPLEGVLDDSSNGFYFISKRV